MATATAMKGLVGAAQANVRAEEESMDPVKLIASDGTEVILDRRAAMVSGTIKAMLSGPGASAAAARRDAPPLPVLPPLPPRNRYGRHPPPPRQVKHYCAELGGNAPVLVFDDADVEEAPTGTGRPSPGCAHSAAACAPR